MGKWNGNAQVLSLKTAECTVVVRGGRPILSASSEKPGRNHNSSMALDVNRTLSDVNRIVSFRYKTVTPLSACKHTVIILPTEPVRGNDCNRHFVKIC